MKKGRRVVLIGALVVIPVFIFYLGFVHYTGVHQVALTWNRISGELALDSVPGFNISVPWVKVAKIDTRPQRVCVHSVGRSFNCKLVRFEPRHWRAFVDIEGLRYYWLGNRISFNWGYEEEYRGVRDLLRGYAFGSRIYPFIQIVQEYGDSDQAP